MTAIRSVALVVLLGFGGIAEAAVLTVNSLADDSPPGDGLVTLREAIIAANADGTTDLGQSGSGADRLDLLALSGSVVLASPLPPITSAITLVGPGAATLTVSGAAAHRILFVDGGTLEVSRLRLEAGRAKGGNGATCQQRSGCGGGGAGLGGAVFVNSGQAVIDTCVIDAGAAAGGNGAGRLLITGDGGGGGGGGIGGNGQERSNTLTGGEGGSPAPLPGVGALPTQNGTDGAGGGGGNVGNLGTGAVITGGNGGYGGGGAGGGENTDPTGGPRGLAGAGGFGGGGGGSGGQRNSTAPDGPGGAGGVFGGAGGPSSGGGNIAGDGGGGAGLGGAIFVRSGAMLMIGNTTISNCTATGGVAIAGNNQGQPGQGKGAALFVDVAAFAFAAEIVFVGNNAANSSGSGYVVGQFVDTDDVHGIVLSLAYLADGFEDP